MLQRQQAADIRRLDRYRRCRCRLMGHCGKAGLTDKADFLDQTGSDGSLYLLDRREHDCPVSEASTDGGELVRFPSEGTLQPEFGCGIGRRPAFSRYVTVTSYACSMTRPSQSFPVWRDTRVECGSWLSPEGTQLLTTGADG